MNNIIDAISIDTIDSQLSQQGYFCLLDWLLQKNLLPYTDYEAWRYGKIQNIDTQLDVSEDMILELISSTDRHARALHLVDSTHDYFSWAETNAKTLQASKTISIHNALTQHWLRKQDLPQLDLFMDNSAVICENEIHEALAARQFQWAEKKLLLLTQLNAKHSKLGAYQDLINYGLHMQSHLILDSEQLSSEINALEKEVIPLARETLATSARDYLAFAWRRLSDFASTLVFNANQPNLHASYALAQIPDWAAALQSLESSPELFRSALLLKRFALCHEYLQHSSEALISWCLLFELDSQAAEIAFAEKESLTLWRLWEDFWDINDGGTKLFFPAFVFIKNPGLIHHLKKFPPLHSASTNAMIDLLNIAHQNGDEIEARKALQNISPALLRLYLTARVSR